MATKDALERLRESIQEYGVLLMHDSRLRCASSLIAGRQVAGSWWGHESGQLIYETLNRLSDDEVAWPKLLGAKVTLVHRRLWPALIAAARSGAPWQTQGLKADAKWLLGRLGKAETLRSDELALAAGSRKIGPLVTELEGRLLVYSEQQHTDAGHHARLLLPYATWQRRKKISDRLLPDVEAALESLSEAVARSLGEKALGRLLPWEAGRKARPQTRTRVRSGPRERP